MIKFQGSYEDYDRWYGVRRQAVNYNGYRAVQNEDTLWRQLKIYRQFYPELVIQMQRPTEGCTIFALQENGKTFVGRNYDWLPEARNFFERYLFEIDGAYRYFGFSDEDVWGRHVGKRSRKIHCEDAVNEHGLYIGLTFAHNFLIADAKVEIAVVEHVARNYEIVRPEADGLVVQTNHCLVPKLQKLDFARKHNPKTDSFLRYEEVKCLVRNQMPGFQFTDIWRILRSSRYVYSKETIWSLALELSEQRFNIYYDTAQGQKQTKFSFDMKGAKNVSRNEK